MDMDKRVCKPGERSGVSTASGALATDSGSVRSQIIGLVLLTVAVASCGCAALQRQAPLLTLRVMTYNIHHGEGTDGKIDLLRIAEVIKQEGADIVALQEVDRGVARTARRDLPEELAVLTGMTCVFSNNFHFQGGEYGNAVLTRFPVPRRDNTHYKMLRPGEQRGLLQLVLGVNGRQLLFMNTHMDYRPDDTERLSNAEEIKQVTKRYGHLPAILCGDFNDTPGSRVHRAMKEQFQDCWEFAGESDGFTYSSDKPRKRIDYAFISKGSPLVPVKAWVPQSDASDHLALVVEFRFE
jgi:endonuclease/exonuclease/phosphatase family metal-dependent hydrolase